MLQLVQIQVVCEDFDLIMLLRGLVLHHLKSLGVLMDLFGCFHRVVLCCWNNKVVYLQASHKEERLTNTNPLIYHVLFSLASLGLGKLVNRKSSLLANRLPLFPLRGQNRRAECDLMNQIQCCLVSSL